MGMLSLVKTTEIIPYQTSKDALARNAGISAHAVWHQLDGYNRSSRILVLNNEQSATVLAVPTHHCPSRRWPACTGKYLGGHPNGAQFWLQRRGIRRQVERGWRCFTDAR